MHDSSSSRSTHVLIVCDHQDVGELFVESLSGETRQGSLEITFEDGQQVQLHILAGDPRLNPQWEEMVDRARGMLLLARFLDFASLDKLKSIYRQLSVDEDLHMTLGLFRQADEHEFKMSCPACGQKLWVQDKEAGKRGRCPTCKKGFRIPSAHDLIRQQLLLPDDVSVRLVYHGDRDVALHLVRDLLQHGQAGLLPLKDQPQSADSLKNATIRVQLSPEDFE